MLPLSAWIQIAGVVQLAIGLANLPLAVRLGYRKNLAGISAMVRQVFYVHAAYIVLVVFGFAALSLLFPAELVGLGRFLSAFLAIFWLLRVPIQLFCYPVEPCGHAMRALARLAIAAVWLYQGGWCKLVAPNERHLAVVADLPGWGRPMRGKCWRWSAPSRWPSRPGC